MKAPDQSRRSPCAIACTLDLVGDKWSLLVIRDMLHGKRTYGELLDSPEAIPTNILADRLKRLEGAGIIASSAYQERPVRYAYALTDKGNALGDVLLELVRWGKRYLPGTRTLTKGLSQTTRSVRPRRSTRTRTGTARAG
jgi:DNA-binding HxlR family transcriptional regulator